MDLDEAVTHEQRVVGVDIDREGGRGVALLRGAVLVELGHTEQLVAAIGHGELHEGEASEQLTTGRDQLVLDDAIGRVGQAGSHEAQLLNRRHGQQVERVDDGHGVDPFCDGRCRSKSQYCVLQMTRMPSTAYLLTCWSFIIFKHIFSLFATSCGVVAMGKVYLWFVHRLANLFCGER